MSNHSRSKSSLTRVEADFYSGSGQYVGHWGGDNEAEWGAMFLSISQSFIFQMSGIPMFGADTCGFAKDSTEELCARWMELSAFFPFFRSASNTPNPCCQLTSATQEPLRQRQTTPGSVCLANCGRSQSSRNQYSLQLAILPLHPVILCSHPRRYNNASSCMGVPR